MKFKEVTKENAESICYEIDSSGFDYAFTHYSDWKKETKGTNLEPLIIAYRTAQSNLENAINDLREKYEIEES